MDSLDKILRFKPEAFPYETTFHDYEIKIDFLENRLCGDYAYTGNKWGSANRGVKYICIVRNPNELGSSLRVILEEIISDIEKEIAEIVAEKLKGEKTWKETIIDYSIENFDVKQLIAEAAKEPPKREFTFLLSKDAFNTINNALIEHINPKPTISTDP